MITSTLPSAFDPDMSSPNKADAPNAVSLITASVLGALIAAQIFRFNVTPGETIEDADRIIAAAVDRVIADLDTEELQRAHDARVDERFARKQARHDAAQAELAARRAAAE